jgi:hypothetical protein
MTKLILLIFVLGGGPLFAQTDGAHHTAQVQLEITKFKMEKTKNGIEIVYTPVCKTVAVIPVFDHRQGGVTPNEVLATCTSQYGGANVDIEYGGMIEYMAGSLKGFFGYFFVNSALSGQTLTGGYSSAIARDLNLKSLILQMSSSVVGQATPEGFLVEAEYLDEGAPPAMEAVNTQTNTSGGTL